MAPRSRAPQPRSVRRAIFVGLAGLAVGVGLFVALLVLADSGDVRIKRDGDERFRAGEAESLAETVESGGPLLFPDASPERIRDIYLQHLGPETDRGWTAFSAQAPGADRDCVLGWDADARELVDTCDGGRFPADGEGLTRYPVQVEEGVVFVDLREGPVS